MCTVACQKSCLYFAPVHKFCLRLRLRVMGELTLQKKFQRSLMKWWYAYCWGLLVRFIFKLKSKEPSRKTQSVILARKVVIVEWWSSKMEQKRNWLLKRLARKSQVFQRVTEKIPWGHYKNQHESNLCSLEVEKVKEFALRREPKSIMLDKDGSLWNLFFGVGFRVPFD